MDGGVEAVYPHCQELYKENGSEDENKTQTCKIKQISITQRPWAVFSSGAVEAHPILEYQK